jgi:hypothetical protein
MVGPSTRRALNSRALGAASWLEFWAEKLADMAVAQDIEFFSNRRSRTTITLTHGEVMDLWRGMHEHMTAIRRFAEHPRRNVSVRRAPLGFTP